MTALGTDPSAMTIIPTVSYQAKRDTRRTGPRWSSFDPRLSSHDRPLWLGCGRSAYRPWMAIMCNC